MPSTTCSLRLPRLVLVLLLVSGATVACDLGIPGSAGEAELDDDTFVEVMVDLRRETLVRGGTLPESARDQILDRHGVTPDDLLEFAEVHGGNVPRMHDIWTRIETELGRGGRMDPGLEEGGETPPLESGAPPGP